MKYEAILSKIQPKFCSRFKKRRAILDIPATTGGRTAAPPYATAPPYAPPLVADSEVATLLVATQNRVALEAETLVVLAEEVPAALAAVDLVALAVATLVALVVMTLMTGSGNSLR